MTVPRDQQVKLEMFDSADPFFHEVLLDDYVTVNDDRSPAPVVVTFDLGDIYTSTYEALITGEYNTIPLILHRQRKE